jgi:hypothetical protein
VLSSAAPSASRRSLLTLARSQTGAFAGQPQVRYAMPVATRAAFGVAIALQLWVVTLRRNASGTASATLIARGYRDWGTSVRLAIFATVELAMMAAALVVLFVVWLPLLVVAVVGFVAVMLAVALPMVRSQWATREPRRRLRALRPAKPYWLIVSMASTEPGQGAELLDQIGAEADRKGWVLVLEAATSGLVKYYARFGFVAAGEGQTMPWQEDGPDGKPRPCAVTCMVRRPGLEVGG